MCQKSAVEAGGSSGALSLGFYRIEDTTLVDAFNIPSIFDARLALYKEWHDFVFFDRRKRIFSFLNFGIYGNPYDSKRGCGFALLFFADRRGRTFAEMKLIALDKLQVSSYNPDFIGEGIEVVYLKDNSFKIKGQIGNLACNFKLPVILPPVSGKDIFLDVLNMHGTISYGMARAALEMAKLWDNWVELPRLPVSGEVTLDGTSFTIDTRTGYHDHEGGRFDWGSTWGWDTGVILCDPLIEEEPENVEFRFYRWGPSDRFSHGGVIIGMKNGERKYFDNENIQITRTGRFTNGWSVVPGITRLLYPDYHPDIPERVILSASDEPDKLKIVFTPKAVCSIVVASIYGEPDRVFNEMFCSASLNGNIGGHVYDRTIPCWFESVRPRGSVSQYAVET
ncbi:MAG: hypothetical protein HYU39_02215 [Thaumarchaeota archaeon]|nr:hypothetical protein [Nitrososphaerota archaeon]